MMLLNLSSRDRCFVIGEAGTCHVMPNDDDRLLKAKRYVMAAKDAGVDCVKFQMFDWKTCLFCPCEGDEQRLPRWKESHLGVDDWRQVKEFTEACGMMFLASVFQASTVEMLKQLRVEVVKVASRAAKNFPYGEFEDPTDFLISTGMEYEKRLNATYLQCESVYPSTDRWTGEHEGFSDHSGTPWRAMDAILRGCRLVEVHFYIDPLDAGPDLPASLNLDQLKLVCEARDAFNELRSDE